MPGAFRVGRVTTGASGVEAGTDMTLEAKQRANAFDDVRAEAEPRPHERPLRFSFVIANHNYARFVGRAIESALGQDWPEVEVVVVDDGSTDGSRQVIAHYGDKITAIMQANAGQRVANNVGFAATTGEVIVFLDADDVAAPDFARAVAGKWRPGLSKVQVQVARTDVHERPLGSVIPAISLAPGAPEIRQWAATTSEYPTPPGSGNAYARSFIGRFFPIGEQEDSSTDSTCLALAPFLGDVETVLKPLVLYRQHGSNDSNLHAGPDRFAREVRRAYHRQQSAERILSQLGSRHLPEPDCLRKGRHLLQLRIASRRVSPDNHPRAAGSWLELLIDTIRSLMPYGVEPARKRFLIAGWALATLMAPPGLARRLIYGRFAAGR